MRTEHACQSRAEQSRAEQSVRRLGNIYGENRGTGFAGNVWDKDCISPTITTCQGGGREPSVIEVMKSKTVQKDNLVLEIKKTLDPKFHNFLYEVEGEIYLVRIRKLIPKECGRLMGVDDESIEKMLSVNSNTQCYKQFGNSIVVPVLMGIFSQLGISGIRRWNDMTDDEINQMIVDCR